MTMTWIHYSDRSESSAGYRIAVARDEARQPSRWTAFAPAAPVDLGDGVKGRRWSLLQTCDSLRAAVQVCEDHMEAQRHPEANGVYHRHGGIDWPSAEKCELCQKDQRIAELEDRFKHVHQNAHDGTDRCAHCGLDLRDPVHAMMGWHKDNSA